MMKGKKIMLLSACALMLTGCAAENQNSTEPAVTENITPENDATESITPENNATESITPENDAADSIATENDVADSIATEVDAADNNATEADSADIITREDPEIVVSAERIQEEIGFSFSVPEGAEQVTYRYDTEYKRGTVSFYLDGVLWDAKVKRVDAFLDLNRKDVDEYTEDISTDLNSDQVLQVHGVDPELHYYRTRYTGKYGSTELYDLSAMWYLEEEGLMVALSSYSETPIHTMPVSVFG